MVDEVYVGPSRRLSNFVEAELPKGLADLGRRLASLESYASLRPDYNPTPSASSVVAAPPARTQGKVEEGTNEPTSNSKNQGAETGSPQSAPVKSEGQ